MGETEVGRPGSTPREGSAGARDREPRYGFGDNWRRFLEGLEESHIEESTRSLALLLEVDDLSGRSFLDVGCGSGLHSEAARRLGAGQILSFDLDPQSVACADELRRRAGSPDGWVVASGSALDGEFLESLPRFDVVYAWGSLHHTGEMWRAIRQVARRSRPGGLFVLGIYHRKPVLSVLMRHLKRVYSGSGGWVRAPVKGCYWLLASTYRWIRSGRTPWRDMRDYRRKRGMDYWTDLDDWLGGYPFECATPDEVCGFVESLGFRVQSRRLGTAVSTVNQFVFVREAPRSGSPGGAA